jgi:hypothetical protein
MWRKRRRGLPSRTIGRRRRRYSHLREPHSGDRDAVRPDYTGQPATCHLLESLGLSPARFAWPGADMKAELSVYFRRTCPERAAGAVRQGDG